MANKATYNQESIEVLKGADRVRKRPAVIFGSDGIEGCEHSVFEIISNSVDEAREGFGNTITVTRFEDKSVEVQDQGRGIPVEYNQKEKEYNWKLTFCELYAGGKYKTNDGGSYQYSLGTNGLGLCATQYASEYMEAEIHSNGFCYHLNFKGGKPVGDMIKEPYNKKDTGTRIKWRPDLKVFTDINIPLEYFQDMMRRQAIVNAGVKFVLKIRTAQSSILLNISTKTVSPTMSARSSAQTDFLPFVHGAASASAATERISPTILEDKRRALLLEQSSAQGVLSQLELP